MQRQVDWMNPVDDYVLRFLERTDAILSPACIARNIDYDAEYVGRRCRRLESFGLLDSEDSYYRLSELGELYLRGGIDPEQLTTPE